MTLRVGAKFRFVERRVRRVVGGGARFARFLFRRKLRFKRKKRRLRRERVRQKFRVERTNSLGDGSVRSRRRNVRAGRTVGRERDQRRRFESENPEFREVGQPVGGLRRQRRKRVVKIGATEPLRPTDAQKNERNRVENRLERLQIGRLDQYRTPDAPRRRETLRVDADRRAQVENRRVADEKIDRKRVERLAVDEVMKRRVQMRPGMRPERPTRSAKTVRRVFGERARLEQRIAGINRNPFAKRARQVDPTARRSHRRSRFRFLHFCRASPLRQSSRLAQSTPIAQLTDFTSLR